MKKIIFLAFILAVCGLFFTGCAVDSSEIAVVSREDGSGTRGAFIELFGIELKGDDGSRTDLTRQDSDVTNKTDVMLSTVEGDVNAIGYVSLSSVNDSVKTLKIDSIEPSAENVKSGAYKISRPFIVAFKNEPDGVARDFIDYILSAEGQAVISENCISLDDNAPHFEGGNAEGRIVIAGSSSVNPVMEKLQEAYTSINPAATIEIQVTDSTSGMNSAITGTCDIGMSSRNLKDNEKSELMWIEIAADAIAVIVNNNNSVSDMTSEVVRNIYTGDIITWDEIS